MAVRRLACFAPLPFSVMSKHIMTARAGVWRRRHLHAMPATLRKMATNATRRRVAQCDFAYYGDNGKAAYAWRNTVYGKNACIFSLPTLQNITPYMWRKHRKKLW